jgi:ribosomal protein L37E
MKVQTFDDAMNTQCQKCGHDLWIAEYADDAYDCYDDRCPQDFDHMHLRCGICGFTKSSRAKDYDASKPEG